MGRIILGALLAVVLVVFPAAAQRYLFHNVYGDAVDLTTAPPAGVTLVPFGWTTGVEATRNGILSGRANVSTLPSLLYRNGTRWGEVRILDMAKPWSWSAVNSAAFSAMSVSLLGDSIFAQMVGVQGSLGAPIAGAQNLAVSGEVVSQIVARRGSASGSTIFIQGGTNDLYGLGSSAGIIPGYTTLLNSLNSTKRVIVMGIPRIDEVQLQVSHPGSVGLLTNANIDALNAQLVTLCNSYSNCTPALDFMNWNVNGKTSDGIHFPAATYPEFADKMRAAL